MWTSADGRGVGLGTGTGVGPYEGPKPEVMIEQAVEIDRIMQSMTRVCIFIPERFSLSRLDIIRLPSLSFRVRAMAAFYLDKLF
jgi:hypothetical protein